MAIPHGLKKTAVSAAVSQRNLSPDCCKLAGAVLTGTECDVQLLKGRCVITQGEVAAGIQAAKATASAALACVLQPQSRLAMQQAPASGSSRRHAM